MTSRALRHRSAKLARKDPAAIPLETLMAHLMEVAAAKPGWRSRNWIMGPEWFPICERIRWCSESPGILYGVHISVQENAGFPRIEAVARAQ